jgi:hypothetical protein
LGALPTIPADTSVDVTELVENREAHLQALKEHLARAQNKMKQMADRLRTDLQFQVGDQVLLKLQPYTQSTVASRPYPKLSHKYYGPYSISEKISPVAYKLHLPDGVQIHPVFHISQLKPYTPDHTPVYEHLPTISDLEAAKAVPASILDRRLVKKGNTAVLQVKVAWTNLPATSTTWEDYYVLHARFPSAPAWGQAGSSGGGGVTPAAAHELGPVYTSTGKKGGSD